MSLLVWFVYQSYKSLIKWAIDISVYIHILYHDETKMFKHITLRVKYYFFPFIFISWRLITLQYCSGSCHTLTWISHRFTCVPHPGPHSHLPLYPLPLGLPSAPGPSTCLMHPTWAGDLFHSRQYTCFGAVLSKHPTLAFSHKS